MIKYVAIRSLLTFFFSLVTFFFYAQDSFIDFNWDQLPEIPAKKGESIHHGLAGAFIGVNDNALSVLVVGAKGSVRSTYNYAAPLYILVIEAL